MQILKRTLSVCFSRMVENTVYSQMWRCTLYFSPSFQILHHKMKKACPVSDKSKTTYTPARNHTFTLNNYLQMIWQILNLINLLLVELSYQQQSVHKCYF